MSLVSGHYVPNTRLLARRKPESRPRNQTAIWDLLDHIQRGVEATNHCLERWSLGLDTRFVLVFQT